RDTRRARRAPRRPRPSWSWQGRRRPARTAAGRARVRQGSPASPRRMRVPFRLLVSLRAIHVVDGTAVAGSRALLAEQRDAPRERDRKFRIADWLVVRLPADQQLVGGIDRLLGCPAVAAGLVHSSDKG